MFIEQLERDPARFLPDVTDDELSDEVVEVDLNRPMSEIRKQLSSLPVKTRLSLTGPLVVARDIAHAKIAERLEAGDLAAGRVQALVVGTTLQLASARGVAEINGLPTALTVLNNGQTSETMTRAAQDALITDTLLPVQAVTAAMVDIPPVAFGDRYMQPEDTSYDGRILRGYWTDTGLPWLPGGVLDDQVTKSRQPGRRFVA